MKRLFWAVLFLAAAIANTAAAGTIAYISDPSEPWGQPGGVNGMNQVYGAGNWSRLTFANAIASGALGYDALYLDGGDGATAGYESFINANRTALEGFVSAGGSLFLNAARWGGANPFNLGFGISLNSGGSSTGHIAPGQAGHPIFVGTINTTWTGSSFSHDYLTGTGLTGLILDASNKMILAEMDYGAGHVMFGGLTLAFFGEHGAWSADTNILRNNILGHVGDQAQAVPAPGSVALIGFGLVAFGFIRRRKLRAMIA